MRAIDVRSFDIPSDENDYDELVAFADTMACVPQFDAVPIEVLDKIRAEIDRQEKWLMDAGYNQYNVDIALNAIKLVVDKYKPESEADDGNKMQGL